ncbi:LOW QUALITY PROTEIN: ATP synthase-coupling factor 6, mitochondrial [Perca fluviatilis]|uniref:LOW QUALITY PROTEIN: ATP synthase-coupling factor 6, mitochondrial n=1 Tax=Perca fluviatilis TaxID=8168 RepID=UPI00196615B5|nr:LOW QUALITY PROTEIN: ATP synthase-coupling factor 6, mitochondrial [Perca fluviatilis]
MTANASFSHHYSHNPPRSSTFGSCTLSVKSKMALNKLFQLSSALRSAASLTLRRNIGISAVLFNRAKDLDPIQKLFLDKIRDYNAKSKISGGIVEGGASYQKNVSEEVIKLQRLYGGGDLAKFPDFKFSEPKLEEVAK